MVKTILGLDSPKGTLWTCRDKRKKGRYMFWLRVKEGWKFAGYNYNHSFFPTSKSMQRCVKTPHKLDIYKQKEAKAEFGSSPNVHWIKKEDVEVSYE